MRVPVTRLSCDTPGCATPPVILEQRDVAPDGWFIGKFGDHCPEHSAEERVREWRPFRGPIHGTPGWQSLRTSKVVYQAVAPTTREAHEGHSAVEAQ